MKNRFIVAGYCEKITIQNNQVIKFKVKCVGKSETKTITLTCYKKELFPYIEDFCNGYDQEVEFECIVYDTSYRDKKTKEWIYQIIVQVEKIKNI